MQEAPTPPDKLDVLAMATDPHGLEELVRTLSEHDYAVDVASGLSSARDAFLASGGHAALILGPDLPPSLARRALDSLRAVDPSLAVVVFGDELVRGEVSAPFTRLPSYHPGSRAGAGAVLKLLHGLR